MIVTVAEAIVAVVADGMTVSTDLSSTSADGIALSGNCPKSMNT